MDCIKNRFTAYLVIAMLGLTLNVKGQYHPTITHSKEWLVKTCEFGNCLYDYYYFVADTSINGLSYKVLDGYHYNKNFYLREDVQQRKVYILINDGNPFPKEYLLYDYSMQVGDSMYVQNPISPVSAIEGYYHLDSVVSQSFEQITRKVFYLHGWDAQNIYRETKWIEGIGSTGLINTPGVLGDTVAMAELLCVSENVKRIYSRKQNDTCYSNPVLSTPLSKINISFEMFFDHQAHILHIESKEDVGVLKIWDERGRLKSEYSIARGSRTLNLSNMENGIYFLRWEGNNQAKVLKILMAK